MPQTLGVRKKKFLFSCAGVHPPEVMMKVAERIIRFAGMTPARPGRIDHYPYDGKGGEGYTLYAPLCESYLMIDVYTDVGEHGESEVLLSTCKPDRLSPGAMTAFLNQEIGTTEYRGSL